MVDAWPREKESTNPTRESPITVKTCKCARTELIFISYYPSGDRYTLSLKEVNGKEERERAKL